MGNSELFGFVAGSVEHNTGGNIHLDREVHLEVEYSYTWVERLGLSIAWG